ncbi:leucine-rich repeat-containing protein kinase family protein [Xenophilus sp.]|uniref:leucine-rich repeat-containing protein kinase family protein n=1 Tax=Xenophilus sp. TaxID=1873499 RepID=UPI0037DC98DB
MRAAPSATDTALGDLRAGRLHGATRLRLAGGLSTFPDEIFTLADTLEVLDLSGNALDALPHDLHRLRRLRVLFCSGNPFTVLPPALGRCEALEMVGFKGCRLREVPAQALPPRLRWLILTDNAIETLPAALGGCTRLQKLMLAGNRLAALPGTLADCGALELLRLAANRFETLPPWLGALPRLAWLACAGNPLCEPAAGGTAAADIPWATLTLGERLGEGASGVIHAARRAGDAQDLAVKLFRGEMTSDGWPASEMTAHLAAGTHPAIVPVLGRVQGHPDGAQGLVMPRLGAEWRNLAGPPDFATCTRDVYAAGLRLPAAAARAIAHDAASAVAHLHARGLVHGDLYAHNILWRPAGDGGAQALLGDFGAAACLPEGPVRPMLQRMEALAFGHLLGELLAHADDGADAGLLQPLAALQARCLAAPEERPAFGAMAGALALSRPRRNAAST